MPSNRLEILVTGDAKQFTEGTLGEVNRAVNDTVAQVVAQSQKMALGLGAVAAAGGALIQGFVSKAGEMQQFEATLTAFTGSAEAAREKLASFADFAATTPFDLPGVVKAGITLQSLGLDADALLPRVGNLAAVMGRDISEAALLFGKAMKGSRDGLQSLFDAGIVTKETLEELGANIDKSGAIAVEGADNIEALQGALQKLVDTKFGSVMENQSKTLAGALSNLEDSLGQAQAALGKELVPTVEVAARSLTSVLEAVRNMDPFMRSLIANGLLAGTMFAAVGAAIATFNLAIVPATAFLTQYATAAQASVVANTEAAVAAHAASVALVTQTEAEVAAAAALVAEAQAAAANAVTKEGSILAAEGLAIAETELAAATEAAAAANLQYTGTAGGVIGAMGAQTTAAAGLSGRLVAMATSVGGIALGLGLLVGGGLLIATASWNAYTEATEKTIAVSENQLRAFYEQKDVVLEAAQAVKEWGDASEQAVDQVRRSLVAMGKDDLDVTRAIAGNGELLKKLNEQLAEAEDAGTDTTQLKAQIAEYEKRNEVLTKARHNMRGMHDEEVAAANFKAQTQKAEQAALDKLVESYKRKSSTGQFESDKEQLASLDEVLSKIGTQHKAWQDLHDSRARLSRAAAAEDKKSADDAAKVQEDKRKERLAGEMHVIDLIVGSDKAAIQKRIALLTQLRDGSLVSKDERMKIEIDLAREVEALEKSKADAAKKAAAEKKKAEEEKKKQDAENARAAEKLLEAQQKGNQADLVVLQERLKRGEDVVSQIEEEIAKRDELAAAIVRQKAKDEGVGKSAKARADLEMAADAEISAQKKRSDKEVEDIRRDQAAKRKQEQSDAATLRAKEAKAQEDDLREQLLAGGKVGDELKSKVKERYQAEEAGLRAKAEANKLDKSATEQANIERQLKLDLLNLAKDKRKEEEAIAEALRKQTDEQKTQQGFTLGNVTEGAGGAGDFSAFDLTAGKSKDKKKTADQVKRDQAKDKASSGADSDGKTMDGPAEGGITGQINANERSKLSAKHEEQQGKMIALLEQIVSNQAKPATVEVKGGGAASGGPTADKDWRTSTNKVGD